MKSILNSISSGDLQVPKDLPVKENCIIDLLQDPEIEFNYSSKSGSLKNNTECSLEDLFKESQIEFNNCCIQGNKLESINTGFSANNDLYYSCSCQNHELKTPLYKEGYLREFESEAEKAAARHALGLYNKEDIVTMSLLTTKDTYPTIEEIKKSTSKQLKKGDQFFTPFTKFSAVFDTQGVSLDVKFKEFKELIINQDKEIKKITLVSTNKEITSLGDIQLFLQGFNNGDNLQNTFDTINKDMLRFEQTGQIETFN